jgi:tRNA (cmo5U34)-methyltransferase
MSVTRLPSNESKSGEDRVFADPNAPTTDFRFDATVAKAFDDMVERSVPFYDEIQRMIVEMARDFAEPGTTLYDLGCSTATTLLMLDKAVDPTVKFVGVDNSGEMLAKAKTKIAEQKVTRPYDLVEADLHNFGDIENASVITMILTLMFIRPLYRQRFAERLYRGLKPGGCVLLVEKLTHTDSNLNRLFINYYYDMKRRHNYSETEISKKREALENVLIPYRYEENAELLKGAGFTIVDEWFRWYNFGGIIAVKK